MKLKSLKNINVKGKRVLVRVDFNVTLTDKGAIGSDSRVKEALPTIQYLLKQGATVILMSHLDRPEGKVVPGLSLSPVAKRLEQYVGKKVHLVPDFWKPSQVTKTQKLSVGSVVLLENIRFHPGEEQNDPTFSKLLASYGDLFVNDAFGTAHRAHASTVGVTKHVPAFAGLLLQKEIEVIHQAITKSKRPLLVIIGGGKTPEKIRVIDKLLEIADTVFLGGAIANTFFAMWGISVGVSRVDHEMIEMARSVFWKATQVSAKLILPKDVVVTNKLRNKEPFVLPYDQVSDSLGIFDVGPQTLAHLAGYAKKAGTIIWNGPMGMYEDKRFMKGTHETLKLVAASSAYKIIGGGDTISTINNPQLVKKIDHISTGGGAMLEFLEKGTLPSIEVLKQS